MLADVHKSVETRNIGIELVGIENYELPITFQFENQHPTIAKFKIGVGIDEKTKGAHLSRIITILDNFCANKIIDLETIKEILIQLKKAVEVNATNLEMQFDIVSNLITPCSNNSTYIKSEIIVAGAIDENDRINQSISLQTTGAMLCPSSKKISTYGAHSQRAEIKVVLNGNLTNINIVDVLTIVRDSFSAPVYGVVKREDEKYMTEKAYENPKFSEDAVRDVLLALKSKYDKCRIEAELHNFESIHQHNVYVKGKIN